MDHCEKHGSYSVICRACDLETIAEHEANQADAQKRAATLADIRAGLSGPELDRSYWLTVAERRRDALQEDGDMFGLVPHEEAELTALNKLLNASAIAQPPSGDQP